MNEARKVAAVCRLRLAQLPVDRKSNTALPSEQDNLFIIISDLSHSLGSIRWLTVYLGSY